MAIPRDIPLLPAAVMTGSGTLWTNLKTPSTPEQRSVAKPLSWVEGGFRIPNESFLDGAESYEPWKQALMTHLEASGFEGGHLLRRDDLTLATMIRATALPSQSGILTDIRSGSEMLAQLDAYYLPVKGPAQRQQLHVDIWELKYNGDAVKYVTEFNNLAASIAKAGSKPDEDYYKAAFVHGVEGRLPDWCARQRTGQRGTHPPGLREIQIDLIDEVLSLAN